MERERMVKGRLVQFDSETQNGKGQGKRTEAVKSRIPRMTEEKRGKQSQGDERIGKRTEGYPIFHFICNSKTNPCF